MMFLAWFWLGVACTVCGAVAGILITEMRNRARVRRQRKDGVS